MYMQNRIKLYQHHLAGTLIILSAGADANVVAADAAAAVSDCVPNAAI